MKQAFNQILFLLIPFIALVSCRQTIIYNDEKFYISESIWGIDESKKYGCDIYSDVENNNLGVEYEDLGGFNGPVVKPGANKFFAREKTPIISYKGTPYTGKIIRYYSNGKVEWENSYTEGVADGDFLTFFENGNIESKSKFKNGVKDGGFECYCKNGAKEKGSYKKGKLNGAWEGFYPDGRVLFRSFYEYNKLVMKSTSYNDPKITNGWNNQRFEIY